MELNPPEKDEENKIDYSLYSEQPEKLFPLAKEKLNKNDFEEGIEILEQSILLAVKKFGGEEKVQLALFYQKYADAVLQKLLNNNQDVLNIDQNEGDEKSQKNEKEEDQKEEKTENKESKENDQEKKAGNEEISDEQIVYDNLAAANFNLKTYLKDYDDKDPKTLDKEIIKYYLLLSDNYSLFANLEKLNSDFKKANLNYNLSIDISKKYDNKFSRNLAGLYFEQAQILDYDPKNCLLSLYKSKVIMEEHLSKELEKINSNIKLILDEKDLDLNDLSYKDEKITQNDKIIQSEEMKNLAKNNCDIEEFVEIIKDINIKIEDVVEELKEYDLFLKTKAEMQKTKENENKFNNNIDLSKVPDITSDIKFVSKKRKEPENSQNDLDGANCDTKMKKDN